MGVSGSGKTTIGKRLSKILETPFYDADDYHTHQNIEKMKKDIALNDVDRSPWLRLLSLKIKEWSLHGDTILACSSLKKSYRYELGINGDIVFIFLDGSFDLIHQRLLKRKGHFFQEIMLESQFLSLERPENCIYVPIDQSIESVCSYIIDSIKELRGAK